MEKHENNRMGDVPTVVDQVALGIRNIVAGSTVSIVDENTIKIVKDDVISSVRVRPNTRSSGYKITHSGQGHWSEDKSAKVIGEVINNIVTISKNKINKIASESTEWDRYNIATAVTEQWKENNKDNTSHPSFITPYYIKPSVQNGIGMSVEIATPNNQQWEEMKKRGATNTKHCIPSGKMVMKIVAKSDADVEIAGDSKIRVHGTIEQVEKIVKEIAGNPMEWGV